MQHIKEFSKRAYDPTDEIRSVFMATAAKAIWRQADLQRQRTHMFMFLQLRQILVY